MSDSLCCECGAELDDYGSAILPSVFIDEGRCQAFAEAAEKMRGITGQCLMCGYMGHKLNPDCPVAHLEARAKGE